MSDRKILLTRSERARAEQVSADLADGTLDYDEAAYRLVLLDTQLTALRAELAKVKIDCQGHADIALQNKLLQVEAERDALKKNIQDHLVWVTYREEVIADLVGHLDQARRALAEDQVEDVALLFHETYERLAPEFGYVTQEQTRVFKPMGPNGRCMLATVKEVIANRRRAAGFEP